MGRKKEGWLLDSTEFPIPSEHETISNIKLNPTPSCLRRPPPHLMLSLTQKLTSHILHGDISS